MTQPTTASRFSFAPGVPEQVADFIQAQIVRGELAPGERIAEARVTAALNVSRGPVREALQRLAARHLVVLEPRRGARVSSFAIDDVRGLFDVYVALVIRLAERVAEHVARGDDNALQDMLDEHRAQLTGAVQSGDTLAVLGACDAFLARGAEVIGNAYLGGMLARLAPAFGRAHYVALNGSGDATARLAGFVNGRARDVAGIVERYAAAQMDVIAQELASRT